jgi:GNAT superfamily N-acetyltransferase
MSEPFTIRLATAADADTIAWHRARMFQDNGEVPAELVDEFRTKAKVALEEMMARGEYIGWLASPANAPERVVGGAGVRRLRALPRPYRSAGGAQISNGRYVVIINVFTEPDWRRRGVAELLLRRIIDWAKAERIERVVLHASDQGRALYERLGFVASNEMRFGGKGQTGSEKKTKKRN